MKSNVDVFSVIRSKNELQKTYVPSIHAPHTTQKDIVRIFYYTMVNFNSNSNSNYFHLVVFCTSRWFRRSVFGLAVHPFAIRLSFFGPKERAKNYILLPVLLLPLLALLLCEAAVLRLPITNYRHVCIRHILILERRI